MAQTGEQGKRVLRRHPLVDYRLPGDERVVKAIDWHLAIKRARRDAVYDVETFLEEEGIGLYRTAMKGDECLVGEQVSANIIRKVLEEDAQA